MLSRRLMSAPVPSAREEPFTREGPTSLAHAIHTAAVQKQQAAKAEARRVARNASQEPRNSDDNGKCSINIVGKPHSHKITLCFYVQTPWAIAIREAAAVLGM